MATLTPPCPKRISSDADGGPPAARSAGTPGSPTVRPSILADVDVLKHIYSLAPRSAAIAHAVVCREFCRALSSTVTELTVSACCPLERLFVRFPNVLHVAVVGVGCAAAQRAGAAGAPHACAAPRLCAALPRCAGLASLDLSRAVPCEATVGALCLALPRCAGLRALSLDQWSARPAEAISLFGALADGCGSLEVLHVSMARVYAVQHAVVPILPRFPRLLALDLSLNGLGAQGAALLRASLPACAALERLNLCSNKLGDGGVELLAGALPLCAVLAALNLAGNGVRAAGALALGQCLPSCAALRELILNLNELGSEGVAHLAAALPACRKLQRLDLGGNNLRADALVLLLPVCAHAHALARLDLRQNGHAPSGGGGDDFCSAIATTRALPEETRESECLAWRLGGVLLLVDAHHAPTLADLPGPSY